MVTSLLTHKMEERQRLQESKPSHSGCPSRSLPCCPHRAESHTGTAGSRCVARTLLSKTGPLTAKAIDLLTQVPESKTWKGIYDTGIDFHTELEKKKSHSGLSSLKKTGGSGIYYYVSSWRHLSSVVFFPFLKSKQDRILHSCCSRRQWKWAILEWCRWHTCTNCLYNSAYQKVPLEMIFQNNYQKRL